MNQIFLANRWYSRNSSRKCDRLTEDNYKRGMTTQQKAERCSNCKGSYFK